MVALDANRVREDIEKLRSGILYCCSYCNYSDAVSQFRIASALLAAAFICRTSMIQFADLRVPGFQQDNAKLDIRLATLPSSQ